MTDQIAWVALIGPLALGAVSGLAAARSDRRLEPVLKAAEVAGVLSMLAAVVAAGSVAVWGSGTSSLLGLAGIAVSVRLDPLSVAMLALVSVVGTVVLRFSRNYLDGDPGQGRFTGDLCLTLAAAALLVVSGNLVQLVAAWIGTSLALHRLLVFYRDRPRAVAAARGKFLVARASDACLIGAALLLATAFGTTDIAEILAQARLVDGAPEPGVILAAGLIVVAALLKSAQFPSHGWLIEVMETPTPVSALLHAGIVNAGGFLVVRFADVVVLSGGAMHLLAAVGAVTALVGSIVMATQSSVKLSLAWSTVAQMGFMMLQCGLGAFALAALHIVAHSAYKAHAFLSSGTAVSTLRRTSSPAPVAPGRVLAGLAAALGAYAALALALGLWDAGRPATLAFGAILVLGVAHLLMPALAGRPSLGSVAAPLAAACGAAVAYAVLHAGAVRILGPVVPEPATADGVSLAIAAAAVAGFATIAFLQLAGGPRIADGLARAAYVHVANGFYLNVLFGRLTGAFRVPGGPS